LLSAGVPLPTVSKRLGRSSVYVTTKIYAHALSRDEGDAAEIWDARMRQAMNTPKEERKKARVIRIVANGRRQVTLKTKLFFFSERMVALTGIVSASRRANENQANAFN
jgi:hypothetical protein